MSAFTNESRAIDMAICRVQDEALFKRWLERFESKIWPVLLSMEGGFSNVLTDAGGPTIYGVTWRTLRDIWQRYPVWCASHDLPLLGDAPTAMTSVDAVSALTEEQACAIAFVFYYVRPRFCLLRGPFDFLGLDYRYNGGPAIKDLQAVAGVEQDSIIGPDTARAVSVLRWKDVEEYLARRKRYLEGLSGSQGWSVNGRGWSNRLKQVEVIAHRLWTPPVGHR